VHDATVSTGTPDAEATVLLSCLHPKVDIRSRSTQFTSPVSRVFGYVLLGALVLQIAVVGVVFVAYMVKNDWRVEGTIMQVWLGAAVMQVIGLAGVVIKYLFSADAAPR
jgi:hypothetical protein